MSIVALGINHKTAPVSVREKLSFNPDALSTALQSMLNTVKCKEAVILSTCNRTELYLVQDEALDITQEPRVRAVACPAIATATPISGTTPPFTSLISLKFNSRIMLYSKYPTSLLGC